MEFRSIIETVRVGGHAFRDEEHFHLASVKGINAKDKVIECHSALEDRSFTVPYDTLVIASGAQPNSFGVKGVEEFAYFLKEIWHARAIRKKILENFELASQPGKTQDQKKQLLHFIVVGGGPTGVEFCAELYDFVQQDLTKIFPKATEHLQVSLIESREILGMFDKSLRDFARKKLQSRPHMQLIKQNCVEIQSDAVILGDSTRVPCGLVVWSAGVGPGPLTKCLPFKKAANGNLMTNQYCQVQGAPEIEPSSNLPLKSNIFAIGDCAEIENYPLPATAQVAQSQAEYLCRLYSAQISHTTPLPEYTFKSKGLMAYIGSYQGLLQTDHTRIAGWKSWFAWRSAYLTELGSWRLRMQVPIDWLKTLLVGRDVSRF